MRAHGLNEFPCAFGQAHTLPCALQRVEREAFQHGDALTKRSGEIDLAVHAAPCDRSDTIFQACEVRKFVERLAGDDGAVHVCDQQTLAAVRRWRGDGINAARRRVPVRIASMSGSAAQAMSTASPGERVVTEPPTMACRAASMAAAVSSPGRAVRVRTKDIGDRGLQRARRGARSGHLIILVGHPLPAIVPRRIPARYTASRHTRLLVTLCACA